jgi:membrane protein
MQAKAFFPLLREAFNHWSEDKASRLAAALAYYTAISIAPLLVLSVTLLKLFHLNGREIVQGQLGSLIGPVGQQAAATMIDAAKQQSGTFATIVSFIILLFGASGVFAELQDSLNTIWEVQPDPKAGIWDTIKKRFFSLAMVFGVIFLLRVSLVISTVLSAAASHITGNAAVIGFLVDIIFSLTVYALVFGLMFMYLPDVTLRLRDTWPGALLTAMLFTVGKYLLTLYLSKGSTASAYGAAGSLAALLIWVYYSAQILFFGAEFTQVYAKKYGSRIVPERGAVPMTEEQRAQRGLVREHDLTVAKAAEEQHESQKGGVFGAQPVPDRRVVTITKPESNTKLALGGLGLAGGLVVAALGMLKGRRFMDNGLEQLRLERRLQRLEKRFNQVPRREIDVNQRLDALDAHIRNTIRTVARARPVTSGRKFSLWKSSC